MKVLYTVMVEIYMVYGAREVTTFRGGGYAAHEQIVTVRCG